MIIDDRIKRYYQDHSRCPKCNEKKLIDTEIIILNIPPENYIDRRNITQCKECGWRGYIDELKV